MKLEWSNRLAAAERTEAQLFPCLNIPTSTDLTKEKRRRRKSIYD